MAKTIHGLRNKIPYFIIITVLLIYVCPSVANAADTTQDQGWGTLGAEVGYLTFPDSDSNAWSKKLRIESQDQAYFFEFSLASYDNDMKIHRRSSETKVMLGGGTQALQLGIASYSLYIRDNIVDIDHAFTVSRGGVFGKPATLVGRLILFNSPNLKMRLTVTYSPEGWNHFAVDRPGWSVTGGRLITAELNMYQIMSPSFKVGLSGYYYNMAADIRSELGQTDDFKTSFYGVAAIVSF